jgi:AcrR family transcriptional regulator
MTKSQAGKTETRPRTRLNPDVRRRSIVEAAFKAIADEGFEGLRTRDIADIVGINSATLHHYFPTKEDLIAGVADHLEARLRSEKCPPSAGISPNLFGALDDQLRDVLFYHFERPEILRVYREFVARAPRDPVIQELVERLHGGWRTAVAGVLAKGKRDGFLRGDLDVNVAAGLVISVAWAFVSGIFASREELSAAARQLNAWMIAQPSGDRLRPVRPVNRQRMR